MLKNLSLVTFAGVIAVGVVCAQQTKMVVPVNQSPANSGTTMYVNYCAPCHGLDGKGNGPVAIAMKQQPTDLTVLSKNNGGNFPDSHIAAVLKVGAPNPAHGTAQMPIWGQMFGTSEQSALRIRNLTTYIRDLQVK